MPYEGTFELTPRCTMNCKMCYVVLTEQQQKKIGEELTAKQWLKIAEDAVKRGMIRVLITGGEPFLRKDFFEILNGVNALGVQTRVNSNATMITPHVVNELKKCLPTRMNISLYGGSNKTYEDLCGFKNGFDVVTRGIDTLLDAGVKVKINFTVTDFNVHDSDAVQEFAASRKLPIHVSSYIFKSLNGDDYNRGSKDSMETYFKIDNFTFHKEQCAEQGRKLKEKLAAQRAGTIPMKNREKMVCGGGRNCFAITWNGIMVPCVMLRSIQEEPLKIGFDAAWDNLVKKVDDVRLPKQCGNCEYAIVCRVCAAQVFEKTGRFDVLDEDLCELAKVNTKILLSYADMDE